MTALPQLAEPPRRRRRSIGRRRGMLGLVLSLPAFGLLGLFFIWPLIRTVFMSLHDWPLLGVPEFIGFGNYVKAFSDDQFLRAVGFTFFYTLVMTPILLVLAFALAFLVRRGTRAHRFFQTIYFLPVVIGLAAGSYIWLFMWQSDIGPTTQLLGSVGLVDPTKNYFADFWTAFAIVVGMVTWKVVGLQMLLVLAGIQAIPDEVNEAARIDGASAWQSFWYITVPLLRPTLALVLVFSVAGSLLAFDQFYIMTTGGPAGSTLTAVYEIYRNGFVKFDVGYASALSILLMVVLGLVSAGQMLLLRNSDNS
ncbi:sugar ABC transporter permease [Herbiconiux moechotypicola]|uniref:Sugar ABC transporter permease n=1 Tax=Herbiconiux moechotypicola TaxID=637393 RepID=A0ABP5Q5T5_9MICO|nr:sugar ABC transporter permease [Herbiconiux moechotypicola]MCS5728995.1 sugar ABC transporter permease [Herbiconiux moechotypicola]